MPNAPIDGTKLHRWDIVVVLWVVFWLVVGLVTWYELWQLTGLSASISDTGRALGTAGQALQDLGGAPFIGERVGELGDQVSSTATGVVRSGETADRSIRRVSVLIGLAVGLGPDGPVLVAYLPSRRMWSRQQRAAVRAEPAGKAPGK